MLEPGLGVLTISATVDRESLEPLQITAPDIPSRYELVGNYPNPFNPSTTIAFNLPQSARVRLQIYDLRGRLIFTVVDDNLPAGRHKVLWNGLDTEGRGVASGTLFYRLISDGNVLTKKMLLLK